MWRKWANRTLLVAVAGSVLLAASSGFDQSQALASVGGDTHGGVTLPPNQGPIGVQAAPSVSIVAPSSAEGDFGANNGNVWDMNSTADIVWRQSDASGHTIALSQPEAGIVHGVTPQGSDLAIGFYTSSSTNLPSSQYHNLIYRLKIAAGPQPASCATNGRVLYTTQWPDWLGHQKYTNAYSPELAPMNCAYGGYCLYYIDLSSNDNGSIKTTWPSSPPPWPTDSVKGFGMWPHERWYNCSGQTGPESFDLDYVYLTGDIVARYTDDPLTRYKYEVKYYAADPDGGTGTADFYYRQFDELQLPGNSPTCNSGNLAAWTHFDQKSISFGAVPSYPRKTYLPTITKSGNSGGGTGQYNQTYTWNLSSGYQDGKSYYLCIRVNDGTSSSYAFSTAPVIRVPPSPYFGPPK
jgi:hypothetical protein